MADGDRLVVLRDAPATRAEWFADLRAHGAVLAVLTRKDFGARYKRAALGVSWAVALPLAQGAVLAAVFSRVIDLGTGDGFAARVMSGMVAWAYFASTVGSASTAIVDNAGLADKVWFPRLLLVLVPVLSNVVALVVSSAFLVVVLPLIGGEASVRLLLLVPAAVLAVAFTAALASVLAAVHVYLRDVRFVLQAALVVWLYLTPVVYPKDALGEAAGWLDLNPLSGVVLLFQQAVTADPDMPWRAVAASVVATVVLGVIGLEVQRRHDRLFVDQL